MAKALQGWISPQGIQDLLNKDIDTADEKLRSSSKDFLTDPAGLNLRAYQLKAIETTENAIISGKKNILLSMATGTGKTRVVPGLIYHFLKTGRFNRILFLVDRNTIGEQAEDVFKEVKLEDLKTLDNMYTINNLTETDIVKETKIQIATVQSMVHQILYNTSDSMASVTDYDLIIIDEAHRGYILDKEMGDQELEYRDQNDYISKYRTVVEFFDAVKIALTATPALQTTQIFGSPVFNYSYREAVIDGYLVDHDAPHTIKTKLNTEGISYQKGETVALYDAVTGEITNSDQLEDELHFDVEQFNRQVITEPFNRTVLAEIIKDIDPEGGAKTLIYAVNDDHADLIVKILKELYEPYDIDSEAIMKITGSVGGGNRKKVLEAVKRFKNERYPSICVTVDLLTTGIDVPRISTIVFLRRVKSRILFEQMLGRATRLCPEIRKTHFEIYDAVGTYDSLSPVSSMKPVVQNPETTFDDLIDGLVSMTTEEKNKNQIDLIVAKLQRRKRSLTDMQTELFKNRSGNLTPDEFIAKIRQLKPSEAKGLIIVQRSVFDALYEGPKPPHYTVISHKEDELRQHTRDYGKGEAPSDYLEEFKIFIENNRNKIEALNVVCTRPSELTRSELRSLAYELDANGYTRQQLNTAYNQLTNEEMAADIISFIRRYAIGSPLMSHEERIKNAVAKLEAKHDFNKMQRNWLNRIELQLLNDDIINRDTFDSGAFKSHGGFEKINRIFTNQLNTYIQELNTYLYEDKDQTA